MFPGKWDDKSYFFKFDTGSDVSIVSSKKVGKMRCLDLAEKPRLRYPTGKKVPVGFSGSDRDGKVFFEDM